MQISKHLHEITGNYYSVAFEERPNVITLPDNENCNEILEEISFEWRDSKGVMES